MTKTPVSQQQYDILAAIAKGHSNREVSERLDLSLGQVERQLDRLRQLHLLKWENNQRTTAKLDQLQILPANQLCTNPLQAPLTTRSNVIVSQRQYEVFQLLHKGYSNQRMARELDIGLDQVTYHKRKLNRYGLIHWDGNNYQLRPLSTAHVGEQPGVLPDVGTAWVTREGGNRFTINRRRQPARN